LVRSYSQFIDNSTRLARDAKVNKSTRLERVIQDYEKAKHLKRSQSNSHKYLDFCNFSSSSSSPERGIAKKIIHKKRINGYYAQHAQKLKDLSGGVKIAPKTNEEVITLESLAKTNFQNFMDLNKSSDSSEEHRKSFLKDVVGIEEDEIYGFPPIRKTMEDGNSQEAGEAYQAAQNADLVLKYQNLQKLKINQADTSKNLKKEETKQTKEGTKLRYNLRKRSQVVRQSEIKEENALVLPNLGGQTSRLKKVLSTLNHVDAKVEMRRSQEFKNTEKSKYVAGVKKSQMINANSTKLDRYQINSPK
jgi:hypothetical protein